METKLPSPFTESSQPFSVKSFRWRIRDKQPKTRLVNVTRNAKAAQKNEA